MTLLLKIVSFAGLALNVVPAFLVFTGTIDWTTHAGLMLVGTIMWFVSAPLWMRGEARLWKRRRPL